VAAEEPILRDHGLSMWGYSVLLRLTEHPVRTQAALAQSIRADKSRIIGVLDDLERRGLIRRTPDPEDRRVNLLELTPEGRRLRESAQAAIQRQEERLLAILPPRDRQGFLNALRTLSGLPREEITGNADQADQEAGAD
jgi:DNA-binding MarR family transcriptional regulator